MADMNPQAGEALTGMSERWRYNGDTGGWRKVTGARPEECVHGAYLDEECDDCAEEAVDEGKDEEE